MTRVVGEKQTTRVLIVLIAIAVILGFSSQTHASLINRGTDTLGNQLIYDTDLNITWYDYASPLNNWWNQANWASNLTVDFNGTIYDGWRLPSTVEAPYTNLYESYYNVTSSEMGHLFYTELGNKSPYDTAGNSQSDWGLTNTGEFQHLIPYYFWSTEVSTDIQHYYAWEFNFSNGSQVANYKGEMDALGCALAVLPGDVAAVPEPGILLLLGTGLAGLVAWGKKFRL